ncbi:hypothetical protein EJ03DRAFT_120243 [Teratosphaeria nubilosa]|uniref:Uncharacterized protein n=1 Tax=Teratosphaeria nubilosa TaxID=161662 RepID=A0A6G1L6B9_9PEZI|nr:hypothetical protein EJ03DRAFT_120243 [Teratosphaeria nubilosa]
MASANSRGSRQELEYVRNNGRLPVTYAANGVTPVLDLTGYGTRVNGGMADKTHRKPMDFLNANSQRDNRPAPLIVNGTTPTSAVKPIGTHDGRVPRAKKEVVFSTDMIPKKWGGNRYILLSNVHKDELEQGGTFSNLSEDVSTHPTPFPSQMPLTRPTVRVGAHALHRPGRHELCDGQAGLLPCLQRHACR